MDLCLAQLPGKDDKGSRQTKKLIENAKINYLSNQPPEIVRLILLKLEIKEVEGVCRISKYFKEKVCTDHFWLTFINKKWKDMNQSFIWAIENRHLLLIKILLKSGRLESEMIQTVLIIMNNRLNNVHFKLLKVLNDHILKESNRR